MTKKMQRVLHPCSKAMPVILAPIVHPQPRGADYVSTSEVDSDVLGLLG